MSTTTRSATRPIEYPSTSSQVILDKYNLQNDSPDEPIHDNKVLISSYLLKRSGKTHQWKKRWVVLRNCQLSYYKDSTEHKPLKVISKLNLLSFSIIPDNKNFHFAIYTNTKVLHLKSIEDATYNSWIDILRQFYDEKSHTDSEAVNLIMQEQGSKQPHGFIGSSNEMDYSGDEPLSSGASDSTPPRTHDTPVMKPLSSFADHRDKDDAGEIVHRVTNLNIHDSIQNGDEYILEQGYVFKLRKIYNQWRKFYFILSNKNLYVYKHQDDISHLHKFFPIDDIIDVIELDPLSKSKKWCFLIITPLKRMKFCASDENQMIKWLSVLKTLVNNKTKLGVHF